MLSWAAWAVQRHVWFIDHTRDWVQAFACPTCWRRAPEEVSLWLAEHKSLSLTFPQSASSFFLSGKGGWWDASFSSLLSPQQHTSPVSDWGEAHATGQPELPQHGQLWVWLHQWYRQRRRRRQQQHSHSQCNPALRCGDPAWREWGIWIRHRVVSIEAWGGNYFR